LFLMKQWRDGKFIDEKTEHLPEPTRGAELGGRDLDRGVLGNMLGGAFCPGAEATWIMRNPAVYTKPYRIKLSPTMMPGSLSQQEDLRVGLEPGDLTKRNAVPWQADFNECSTQSIDITYEGWNEIYSQSIGAPVQPSKQTIYWWPSHRPMEVTLSTGAQVPWSGTIPSEHTGDLAMVTAWKEMGFVVDFNADTANPQYVLQEGWNSVPPLNKHPKGVDDETKE